MNEDGRRELAVDMLSLLWSIGSWHCIVTNCSKSKSRVSYSCVSPLTIIYPQWQPHGTLSLSLQRHIIINNYNSFRSNFAFKHARSIKNSINKSCVMFYFISKLEVVNLNCIVFRNPQHPKWRGKVQIIRSKCRNHCLGYSKPRHQGK